jgi:hypothetical protein
MLAGCKGKGVADEPLECTATVADIPMLVDLAWTAPDSAERSWVDYTTVDGISHQVSADEPAGAVAITLFGAGPEELVSWSGHSVDDAGLAYSCSGTTTTGALGYDVPSLAVTVDNGGWDPDVNLFFGAFYELMGDTSHIYVVDRTGKYLWYVRSEEATVSVDVRLPRDGNGLLFNQFRRDFETDDSYIRRFDWHGDEIERTATPRAHHTFTELPDGTFAYNQLDAREILDPETGELALWVGDSIAEVVPGGRPTTVFSVWDWKAPEPNQYTDGISLYGGLDWTHGNLVSYDEEDDHYLLSLAHTGTILDVNRDDMVLSREFGDPGYHFTEGSTPFAYQHNPLYEDESTILMFSSPGDGSNSGAYEYSINNEDGSLTETWHYQGDTRAFCLGQAIPLPSTNVLVNYGCSASMEEVGRDGTVRWRLDSSPGTGFGQIIPLATPPWVSE